MTGKTITERLGALHQRATQIEAQTRALAARARADSRRRDTRARCVLAGAFVALLRGEADVRAGLCRAVLARVAERDRALVASALVSALGADAPPVAITVSKGASNADQ